jgi:autotransporter-associated beta strand protein
LALPLPGNRNRCANLGCFVYENSPLLSRGDCSHRHVLFGYAIRFYYSPLCPVCGGRSTDKYVGPGAAWSDGNNWLDQDLAHNPPSNGDDVFIGGSPGMTTTDDIASLNIPRLIFNQGSNFLSIGAGSTLIIDPTDEPTSNGVELTNGASASIEIFNNALLQFKNASSAVGVPITVDAGGTFDVSSVTTPTQIGSLAGGNGTVKLSADTLTVGAVNTSTSTAAPSPAPAALSPKPAAAHSRSAARVPTAARRIAIPALFDVSNDTGLGTSAVTIAQGASLNVSSGGSVTIGNNIAGNGGVNINPNSTSGALSFTNANTYNGNTVIQAGTFFAKNSSGLRHRQRQRVRK